MRNNFLQVFTTVPKKSDAEKIAQSLVRRKLSACAQIVGPVESVYNWKGKVEKSKEWLCIIKTKQSLYKKVEKEIQKIHPYELPEVIALPITEGSKKYLSWVSKEIRI